MPRVIVEKPFGHDLASARALSEQLRSRLDEQQILRIDHFLGKEPAMDIMYLRFANSILEPLWNRDRIRAVQITMAENFGVEDRGGFYDAVGTLRDVVQNHLLQLVGLFAAEAPSGTDANALRDKRVEVFKAIPALDPRQCVRGQYDGYLNIVGVKPDSQTETFIALRLQIDNWRWSGVPFFIRAGKEMPVRATEIRVIFRQPPKLPFLSDVREPNELVLRIDPDAGVNLMIQAKEPGANSIRAIDLPLVFADQLAEAPLPYERLLGDAMRGDSGQFIRQDGVEETWRIVQPLLDHPPALEGYRRGAWGPPGAARLVTGHPGWREPWLRPT